MWRSTQLKRRKMSFEQTEDLKAFERRLTEVIDKLQPTTRFWRFVLVLISVCTAIGAWTWLWDPNTSKISFHQSLWNHPFFTISCIILFGLFLFGIHKRVVAPSIASRCRHVLSDYNMSCDDYPIEVEILIHTIKANREIDPFKAQALNMTHGDLGVLGVCSNIYFKQGVQTHLVYINLFLSLLYISLNYRERLKSKPKEQ